MSGFISLWNNVDAVAEKMPLEYSRAEWEASRSLGQIAAQVALGHRLSRKQELMGAAVAHYSVAAGTGVLYSMVPRRVTKNTAISCVIFGILLWLASDEVVLSTLKFKSYNPVCDWRNRAQSFGEHLVYGIVTDLVCRRLAMGCSRSHLPGSKSS